MASKNVPPKEDRYAVLDQERMPWGKYAGRRISELSVDYCQFALSSIDQMHPLLRKLLKLRIDKEKNWLKDLKERLAYYESLAGQNAERVAQLETENEDQRQELAALRRDAISDAAPRFAGVLRTLRRRFAARYHPDATQGSTAAMALVNQIFNELESEVGGGRPG